MIQYFNYSLKECNSFGIDVSCDAMVFLESKEDIEQYLPLDTSPFIIGSGSNILFTDNVNAELVKIVMSSIEVVEEDDDYVIVNVGAGMNWHEFVLWCLDHDYGGVENLSYIPGTVGAAPIQNIGAYGVELETLIHQVDAYHIKSGKVKNFTREDCEFAYRNSAFKSTLKGQYLISEVQFCLTKKNHIKNTSYAPLRALLQDKGIYEPSIQDISQAVTEIRQSKLPDPLEIGNAGSFFKNPIIPIDQFTQLSAKHDSIKSYPVDDQSVKVPAAWLIDQCGWKGYREGDIGVHEKHALVLVNYGSASGQGILELSEKIARSVHKSFGIELEREVNVV